MDRPVTSEACDKVLKIFQVLGWTFFAVGLALYLLVNVGLAVERVRTRQVPAALDDAYGYILRAVVSVNCLTDRCLALEDLKPQLLAPTNDADLAEVRYREYQRAFMVYHPLHSILNASLHKAGLSWEAAYDAIRVVGAAFLTMAIAYWLLKLWSPGPAGVSLGLLSFMLLPDYGVHWIIPSNLALGIAIFVWARIFATNGAAEKSLIFGIPLMVTMHPIGRLLGIATVVLFVISSADRGWPRKKLAAVSLSIVVVAFFFLLPLLVSHPVLDFTIQADPPPSGWPTTKVGVFVYGLYDTFTHMNSVIRKWINLYGSVLSMAVLTVAGFLTATRIQRARLAPLGTILFVMFLVGCIYTYPHQPADLGQRLWVPLVIFLTSATGNIAWVLLTALGTYLLSNPFKKRPESAESSSGLSILSSPPSWTFLLTIAIGICVVMRIETGVFVGANDLLLQREVMKTEPWLLDENQPRMLLERIRPSDVTLYLDEVPMHFYLTHGALKNRAIFLPSLALPSRISVLDPDDYIESIRTYDPPLSPDDLTDPSWLRSDNLRYAVHWNPISHVNAGKEAMVPMSAFESIGFASANPVNLKNVRLRFLNNGPEARVTITYGPSAHPTNVVLPVPSASTDWLALHIEGAGEAVYSFNIATEQASPEFYLKGISLGDTTLNWPWADGAALTFHGRGKTKDQVVPFDPSRLFPIEGLNVSVKILNDNGSTVLGELVK